LSTLKSNLPTKEELEAIERVDASKRDSPDKFLLELSLLPQVEMRIQCMLFKINFDDDYAAIELPLDEITKAFEEVRYSTAFRELFSLILTVGNYMNGGTKRGQADGFNLEIINKLYVMKDNSGETNLLEFIAVYSRKNNPSLLQGLKEMTYAEKVCAYSIREIAQEASELIATTKAVAEVVTGFHGEPVGDKFEAVIKPFVNKAGTRIEQLSGKINRVKDEFTEFALWFGYSKQIIPTKSVAVLFGTLNTFIKSFIRMWEQLDENEKKASLAVKKTEVFKKIAQTRTNKGKIGDGENPFDELANQIKSGNITARTLFK